MALLGFCSAAKRQRFVVDLVNFDDGGDERVVGVRREDTSAGDEASLCC